MLKCGLLLHCHYFNNFKLAKPCSFYSGDVTGGREIRVGMRNNEDECARLVKMTEPTARGAKWYTWQSCYAEFGNQAVVRGSGRACLFAGTFSSIPVCYLIIAYYNFTL